MKASERKPDCQWMKNLAGLCCHIKARFFLAPEAVGLDVAARAGKMCVDEPATSSATEDRTSLVTNRRTERGGTLLQASSVRGRRGSFFGRFFV